MAIPVGMSTRPPPHGMTMLSRAWRSMPAPWVGVAGRHFGVESLNIDPEAVNADDHAAPSRALLQRDAIDCHR